MKDKVCSYLDQVGVWLESPDLVENAYNPVNVFTRTFMAIDSVGFAAAVLEGIDAGKALSPDATDVFYSSPETGVCKDRMRLSKTENGMLLGFEKREDLVVEKMMVLRLASC